MRNCWIQIAASGVISLGFLTAGALAEDPPNIREREKNQQKRIAEGAQSGELTKKEVKKLEKQEANLHRQIQRADGPGLTPKERARIRHKQKVQSRRIYRQKHDKQKRQRDKKASVPFLR